MKIINDDILAIKDSILTTVGENCEKIYLFGSYAYGTPHEDSDYDFFVVLKDDVKTPLSIIDEIYRSLCGPGYKPTDILVNHKSHFERRSTQPTMERKIAREGVVLYER
jgi:predicted nucleotidyltransferase